MLTLTGIRGGRSILAGAILTLIAGSQSIIGPPTAAGECRISHISTEVVGVAPEVLYVGHQVLASSPTGDIVMTGVPTYRFGPDSVGTMREQLDPPAIGVVLDRQRSLRSIYSPDPTRTLIPRWALPLSDGHWEFVFLEMNTGPSARRGEIQALWHGVQGEAGWDSFDRIDVPFDLQHHNEQPVHPVVSDGRVMWVESTRGGGLVFIHRDDSGSWTSGTFPSAGSITSGWAFYPRLIWDPAEGLLLLAVHPDSSLPSDGNSLFLWRVGRGFELPSHEPELIRNIASSADGDVFNPAVDVSGPLDVVGWIARGQRDGTPYSEARVIVDPLEKANNPQVLGNVRTMMPGRIAVHRLEDGTHLLLLLRQLPDSDQPVLYFLHQRAHEFEFLAEFVSPFIAVGITSVLHGAELLVTGGVQEQPRGIVASHIMRFSLDCS